MEIAVGATAVCWTGLGLLAWRNWQRASGPVRMGYDDGSPIPARPTGGTADAIMVAANLNAPASLSVKDEDFLYSLTSADQRAVLAEMSEERGYRLSYLVSITGLPEKRVTAARKELAAKRLAMFVPLFDDEGELRGRGYVLTQDGVELRDKVNALALVEARKNAA